jgi:hypothetical protein
MVSCVLGAASIGTESFSLSWSAPCTCFAGVSVADGGVTDSAGDIALVGTDGWVMTSNPPPLQYLDAIFSANW